MANSVGSPGALFLPVRLDLNGVQKDFEKLGASAKTAFDGKTASAGFKVATTELKALNSELSLITAQYRQIAKDAANIRKGTGGGRVPVDPAVKAQKEAEKLRREQEKAERAVQKEADRVRREAEKAAKEQAKIIKQAEREAAKLAADQRRAANEQTRALKAAKKEAEKLAKEQEKAAKDAAKQAKEAEKIADEYKGIQGIARAGATGATELFTGLGAARSGNYFYALAAATRYAKNIGPAFREAGIGAQSASTGIENAAGAASEVGMQAAQAGAALGRMGTAAAAAGAVSATGIGAVVIAAAAAAAAVTAINVAFVKLTEAVGKFGTEAAIELQTAKAQFTGLLGSAGAAADEMDFLFRLGEKSTVPTNDLINLDKALVNAGISSKALRRQMVADLSTIATAGSLTQEQIGGLLVQIQQAGNSGVVRFRDLQAMGTYGLPSAELIKATADATGKSVAEINKDLREGGLSLETFNEGLRELAKNKKGTEALVQGTVMGLTQQIRDMWKTGFAATFESAGVADNISRILKPVAAFLSGLREALKPTAQAFATLFAAVADGVEGLGSSGGRGFGILQILFGEVIPNLVRIATQAIRTFFAVFKALKPFLVTIWRSVSQFFAATYRIISDFIPLIAGPLLTVLGGLTVALLQISALLKVMTILLHAASAGFEVFFAAANGDLEGAKKKIGEGFEVLKGDGADLMATFEDLKAGVTGIGSLPGDIGKAFNLQDFEQQLAAATGAAEAAGSLAPEIDSALQDYAATMQSFMGTASDFTKSWLGSSDGFTAGADEIIEASKELNSVVKTAFTGSEGSPTANSFTLYFENQTEALLALAEKRDDAVKKLEKSQDKLQDLLQERRDFAANITSSFGSFMGSLTMGEKQVEKFRKFAGNGTAGWVKTVSTENTSVAQTLKDRLRRLKEFVANIRKAQSKNIDGEFLRQVIAAGPESGGEVAKQLANASAAEVADINSSMKQYRKLTRDFAKEQEDLFKPLEIEAARSRVDAGKAEVEAITAAADVIVKDIEAKFKELDQVVRDAAANHGFIYGSNFNSGFQKGIAAYDKELSEAGASAYGQSKPDPNFVSLLSAVSGANPFLMPNTPFGPTTGLPLGGQTLPNDVQVGAPVVNVTATMTIDGEQFTPVVKKVVTTVNSEEARKINQRGLRR